MTASNDQLGVRFLRVLGHRSNEPTVIATVGGNLVRWDRRGWTCDCDTEGDTCPDVEAVADLLDPRVTGEVS